MALGISSDNDMQSSRMPGPQLLWSGECSLIPYSQQASSIAQIIVLHMYVLFFKCYEQ